MMQALPSLKTEPSSVSEMRLVSGPSILVKRMISYFGALFALPFPLFERLASPLFDIRRGPFLALEHHRLHAANFARASGWILREPCPRVKMSSSVSPVIVSLFFVSPF